MMSSMTGLEPRSLIDALPSGLLAELTAADRGSWQSIREQASRELSSSDSDPRKQFALNYALLQTYRGTVDNDALRHALQLISLARSEERRVGKECTDVCAHCVRRHCMKD